MKHKAKFPKKPRQKQRLHTPSLSLISYTHLPPHIHRSQPIPTRSTGAQRWRRRRACCTWFSTSLPAPSTPSRLRWGRLLTNTSRTTGWVSSAIRINLCDLSCDQPSCHVISEIYSNLATSCQQSINSVSQSGNRIQTIMQCDWFVWLVLL